MRTALFLTSGLLLMASILILAKLFSEHFRSAPNWALALGLGLWLAATGQHVDRCFQGGLFGCRRVSYPPLAVCGSSGGGSVDTVAVPIEPSR